MRRSAAPSQQIPHKRPCFNSPILAKLAANSTHKVDAPERTTNDILKLIQVENNRKCEDQPPEQKKKLGFISPVASNVSSATNGSRNVTAITDNNRSSRELPNVTQIDNARNLVSKKVKESCPSKDITPSNNDIGTQGNRLKAFKTPLSSTSGNMVPSRSTNELAVKVPLTDKDSGNSKYLSVMWCKLSKKKHKKWEGDAILVTSGRSVTLLDMEGKDIGRGQGYKSSELETLSEGHLLVIGGKEIEVMGVLSAEDFRSGKCFNCAAPATPVLQRPAAAPIKPFLKPTLSGSASTAATKIISDVRPRFDPQAPNALVMQRPSQSHQWQHNRNGLPVVDVVVDPYLSNHLRAHQRDGVSFLYQCIMGLKNYTGQGVLLADEMGLGKTLQCISVIWTVLKQGMYGSKPPVKKVLIITPGSLVKNWMREFRKWLGNERIRVYAVSPENRVEEFISLTTCPVLIISYEMFVRSIEAVRKVAFDLVVCDEGHRLKNTNIKTTTLVASLDVRRRMVLSGTPIQNDLQELFAIVDFCNPGILGSSASFRRVYEDPLVRSRQPSATPAEVVLGERRAAELSRITSLFILRRTSEINNKYLPPKVELVLFCPPSPLQSALYTKLLSSRVVRSCFSSADPSQHLMCISALRKLCNHPQLLYIKACSAEDNRDDNELYVGLKEIYPESYNNSEPVVYNDSGKLATVVKLLHSFHKAVPRQRVVLVSNYTQTLDVLAAMCADSSYSYLRLDGSTPTASRQQLVERFNSKYSTDFIFLLSSKAGGVGLNLIGASRLILYDIDWNPANDLQAMARVWRDGQMSKVLIYRLLTTGSIEEKMYQRQVSKQGLSGAVVDAKLSTKVSFSPQELKDLFALDETTLCATHELLCDCDGQGSGSQTQQSEEDLPRACQLNSGGKSKKSQQNICMSELLHWQHVTGPAPPLDQVDCSLEGVELEEVSYIFWNESNPSNIAPDSE